VLATACLLAGCAQGPFSTQESRIGPDDGTDSCRPQLVALDSTGNFFGPDILKGAAIGAVTGATAGALFGQDLKGVLIGAAAGTAIGAASGYWVALQQQSSDQSVLFTQVQGDLERENAQIDRTQLAFDQLSECRFRQADAIRADYRAGRIDRPGALARMATVKARAQRDLALARQINNQIANRGQQFDVAADNLSPGTTAAVARQAPPSRQTTVRQATQLKLRPDPSAPDLAQLQPRQPVTVSPGSGGYALVQTASGDRGYAPASALQGGAGRSSSAISSVGAGGTDAAEVRTLDGSNAARRDSFADSVAVTEHATSTGFELAG
jgi:hypothetical protein